MSDRLNNTRRVVYVELLPGTNHVHSNESPVRGRIRVDPTTRPLRLKIIFVGREKCNIVHRRGNSSTTYKEKPVYFAHEQELFSSDSSDNSYDILKHGIAEDGRVMFPFEFRFPQAMEIQPKPASHWPESGKFISEAGQLPPSYYFSTGYSSAEQKVEYYLEAKLYTNLRIAPDVEVRQPVIYRPQYHWPPSSPIPTFQEQTYHRQLATRIRTHKLHPDYDPNEGFKDKLKHRWTKNDNTTPTVTFQLKAECRRVVTLGEPVRFKLLLKYLERSSDIPDPPPIFLRRILVRVESRTLIRVPRVSAFIGSEVTELNDMLDDVKTVLLDERFSEDDGKLLYDGMPVRTKIWPISLTPPFKSYGLNLEHTMQVKAWGECAGEKFEVRLVFGKLLGVQVLEEVGNGEGPVVTMRQDGVEGEFLPPPAEEDVPPPPYQVVGKS